MRQSSLGAPREPKSIMSLGKQLPSLRRVGWSPDASELQSIAQELAQNDAAANTVDVASVNPLLESLPRTPF